MPPLPLTAVFGDLPDPRRETKNKLHGLADILAIATGAVIGRAESWEAIAEYGRAKEPFFRRFLPPPTASRAPARSGGCSPSWPRVRSPGPPPGGWPGRARRPA